MPFHTPPITFPTFPRMLSSIPDLSLAMWPPVLCSELTADGCWLHPLCTLEAKIQQSGQRSKAGAGKACLRGKVIVSSCEGACQPKSCQNYPKRCFSGKGRLNEVAWNVDIGLPVVQEELRTRIESSPDHLRYWSGIGRRLPEQGRRCLGAMPELTRTFAGHWPEIH